MWKQTKELMNKRMRIWMNLEFDKQERNATYDDQDARFYNNNGEYDVVDDIEPRFYLNHLTTSTSTNSNSVSQMG